MDFGELSQLSWDGAGERGSGDGEGDNLGLNGAICDNFIDLVRLVREILVCVRHLDCQIKESGASIVDLVGLDIVAFACCKGHCSLGRSYISTIEIAHALV